MKHFASSLVGKKNRSSEGVENKLAFVNACTQQEPAGVEASHVTSGKV